MDNKDGYTKSVTITAHDCGETEDAVCDPKANPDVIRTLTWESNGPTPGKVPLGKVRQSERRPKEDQKVSEPMLTGTAEPMPTELALGGKNTAKCPEGELCAQNLTYGHNYNFHWVEVNIDYCGGFVPGLYYSCYGVTFPANFRTGRYGQIYDINAWQYVRYAHWMADQGPTYNLPWNCYNWWAYIPCSGFRVWKQHRFQYQAGATIGARYYPTVHWYMHGDGTTYAHWWSH